MTIVIQKIKQKVHCFYPDHLKKNLYSIYSFTKPFSLSDIRKTCHTV